MRGYFISSIDMHMLEDTMNNLINNKDNEEDIAEALDILKEATPIIVSFEEREE